MKRDLRLLYFKLKKLRCEVSLINEWRHYGFGLLGFDISYLKPPINGFNMDFSLLGFKIVTVLRYWGSA